jgi:hypothetical protein
MRNGGIYRREFGRGGYSVNVDVRGQLTLDEDALMTDPAIEGVGIAFVPEHAAVQRRRAREDLLALSRTVTDDAFIAATSL